MRKMLYLLFAATILVSCGTNINKGYNSVDADSFAEFIADEQVQLIDSRTPEEFNAGHIPGAVNINIDDDNFRAKVNELDKSRPIAVYCRGGRRSKEAADIMVGVVMMLQNFQRALSRGKAK